MAPPIMYMYMQLQSSESGKLEFQEVNNNYRCTVEPLYSGHHWDHSKCPDFRGFLISGVDLICMYLWQNHLRGVRISGVSGVRGFTVFI